MGDGAMSDAMIEMENARLHYKTGNAVSAMMGLPCAVKAVDGVTLTLRQGESVGLLGESGCGKTSMGRVLVRLEEITGGSARFDGQEIKDLKGAALRRFRSRSQMIFQNPFDAVNPRYSIRRTLEEPLSNARIPRTAWYDRIVAAMELVGLSDPEQFLERFSHQLSGGQLQRVVMARALILEPDFVVADEPVSMLDVSVRAGVLNVFRDVRDRMGLTAIYISHDLALVRYVCEWTIVMYLGKIMEDGPTDDIVRAPLHPYSQALVAAVPIPRVDQNRDPLPIGGGSPDPRNPPPGCVFHDRCPRARARCAEEAPLPRPIGTRHVACHFAER